MCADASLASARGVRAADRGAGPRPEHAADYVGYRPFECWTLGGECDGGFAQFAVAPDRETLTIRSDWSDAELAAVPCAYSTAENMLHRAGVGAERVLVTGASGCVELAAVQLAKRRGATVIAACSPEKAAQVKPPFDLQQLNAHGSLTVTRPKIDDFLLDADERRWRSAEVVGMA